MPRFDLRVFQQPAVKVEELARKQAGEWSELIRERVEAARERQHHRFAEEPEIFANAHMGSKDLRRCWSWPTDSKAWSSHYINSLDFILSIVLHFNIEMGK